MTLHTDLPIYRKGVDLLKLAFHVQQQMPRSFKRTLGEKITVHCADMLDLMALANASRGAERAAQGSSKTIASQQGFTRAWCRFDLKNDPWYILGTSKEAGIGVPLTAAAKAAATPQCLRLRCLCPQFRRLGWGASRPAGCASGPGTPTRSSCRPQLALGAAVVANRPTWRPNMANGTAAPQSKPLCLDPIFTNNWRMQDNCVAQLNPASTLHDRVAWCWATAAELNEVALLISENAEVDHARIADLFTKRLTVLTFMLENLGTWTAKHDQHPGAPL